MVVDGEVDNNDDNGKGGEALSLESELRAFYVNTHGCGAEKKSIHKNMIRAEDINKLGRRVLDSGPDQNGKAELDQLEMIQELHLAYE